MKKVIISIIVIVVLCASIGISYYFYNKYEMLKNHPEIVAQNEQNTLVNKVENILELPKDEKPLVVVVDDKSKLQDQSFFQNAENGDIVLFFTNAKKVVLYRPSTNKVVDVAPYDESSVKNPAFQDISTTTDLVATSTSKK